MSGVSSESIDLVMIGKTGSGKSASANVILGSERFVSSGEGGSITDMVRDEFAEHSGYMIKVVDTPGMCDTTQAGKNNDKQYAAENMALALAMCQKRVHAFLFVISYADRRETKENLEVMEMLTKLLDPKVKKHCVIIVTHGETFDCDHEASGKTFLEWCKTIGGKRGELFKECGYRCVLFHNKATVYEAKRRESVKDLLSFVDDIITENGPYTHELFIKAAAMREKMIIDEKAPMLCEEIRQRMSLLAAEVNKCYKKQSEIHIGKILERADQLRTNIDELVAKSEVFEKLKALKKQIKVHTDGLEKVVEDRKKGNITEKEFDRKVTEKVAALQKNVEVARREQKSSWREFFKNCLVGVGLAGGAVAAGCMAPVVVVGATISASVPTLGAIAGATGVLGAAVVTKKP